MTDFEKLPPFEGLHPDTAAVSFTGGQEGQPPHIGAYRRDQPVAFLVLGEVGDITHGWKGGEKDRRYVRGHKIVVEKVIRLDADEAARIYNNAVEALMAGSDPEALDLEPAVPVVSGGCGPEEYEDLTDDEFDGYVPEHPLEALEADQDAQHEAEHGVGVSDF